MDSTTPIAAFLDAAAAKQPTPGGGSVAALAGALAASMGEMVVNYSVGKKNLAEFSPQHQAALAQFHQARQLLLGLMVEDQMAYEAMTQVRKLPEDSDQRAASWAPALLTCVRVPQTIAATGLAVLRLAEQMVEKVNVYLLSDLAVCADLAMATVRCGLYNVRVNLSQMPDMQDRVGFENAALQLLSEAVLTIQRLSPRIWKRVAEL